MKLNRLSDIPVVLGLSVNVRAKDNASKRTKERIKAHGPTFTVLNTSSNCAALQFAEGILVKSITTSWFGWLPVSEIEDD